MNRELLRDAIVTVGIVFLIFMVLVGWWYVPCCLWGVP